MEETAGDRPDGGAFTIAKVALGHLSDRGMKRAGNEDAYLALSPPNLPRGIVAVWAVADGMGGHQAGEVASALAIETIRAGVASELAVDVPGGDDGAAMRAILGDVVQAANAAIMAQATGVQQGMGTTLTLGVVERHRLHLAHVGDSRGYLLRQGTLRAVTRDHSWVAEEVRAGRLAASSADKHPRRNLLLRALGADESVAVDTQTLDLEAGDVVMLCSDGLHGVVADGAIAEVLTSITDPQRACATLVEWANANGGPDNITVLVARIEAFIPAEDAVAVSPPADEVIVISPMRQPPQPGPPRPQVQPRVGSVADAGGIVWSC